VAVTISVLEAIVASSFIVAALFSFLAKLLQTVSLVRRGRRVNRWNRIGRRLWSLFAGGLLQTKIARQTYAYVLHFFIFWAFVILLASVLEITAQAWFSGWRVPTVAFPGVWTAGQMSGALYVSQDLIAVLGIVGVVMALFRRLVLRPAKLVHEGAGDALRVLLFILGILVSLLLYNAANIALAQDVFAAWRPVSSWVASTWDLTSPIHLHLWWWAHVLLLFGFLAYIPFSKHTHIVFAMINSFFVDLEPKGALTKVDLEKTETFGANRVEQLSWRDLLDGFACTECGRCTEACPANATGKELNPMLLITNMRDTLLDQGEAIQSGETAELPGMLQTVHTPEAIWACTTCYACVYECPVFNEHVPKIMEMRRHMVLMEGQMPPESVGAMRNIETNFNPWGIAWDQRGKWAEGLDVPVLSEGGWNVEYLFWVGCAGSFDDRNRRVVQAFARVMKKAGVKFAILGKEEKCTGDPARRLGNEYLFQAMAKENIATLKRRKVRKIVTACPHCFNTLKNEYPQFGGRFEVIHHTQLLKELLDKGKIRATKALREAVTYHDACYLSRYNGIIQEPRDVLLKLNVVTIEMEKHGDRGFCCGAGGARMWMEETVGEKVNHRRLSHVEATGAKNVVSACPYCLIMFDDAAKTKNREDIQRQDIVELLEQAAP